MSIRKNRFMVMALLVACVPFQGQLMAEWQEKFWSWNKSSPVTQSEMNIEALAISGDGKTIYAGGHGFMFASRDAGLTWDTTAINGSQWLSAAVADDGQNAFICNFPGTLTRTSDGGANWETIPQLAQLDLWSGIAVSADGRHVAAAMFRDAIALSDDGGDSWALAYPAGTNNPAYTFLRASSDGRYIVCGSNKNNVNAVYVSDNFGLTWTKRSPADETIEYSRGYVADNAALVLVASDNGLIYASSNFGRDWTALTAAGEAKWRDLSGARDGSFLIALSDSAALISRDRGATWENRAPQSASWIRASCSKNAGLIAISTNSNPQGQLYLSRDQGKTWTAAEIGSLWTTASLADSGGYAIAGDVHGRLLVSKNGGKSWEISLSQEEVSWTASCVSSDGAVMLAANSDGLVFLSRDIGASWETVQSLAPALWRFAVCAPDGQHIFISGGLSYVSHDGGESWTAAGPEGIFLQAGAISENGQFLCAAAQYGLIHISSNGGDDWASRDPAGEEKFWTALAMSAEGDVIVAAAQDDYLYSSANYGLTWGGFSPTDKPEKWSALAMSADGTVLLTAIGYISNRGEVTEGNIVMTPDFGATWTTAPADAQPQCWKKTLISADGSKILAAAAGAPLFVADLLTNPVSLIVSPATGGAINPAPGVYWLEENAKLSVNAAPLDGYAFGRWTSDGGVSLADAAATKTEATINSLARLDATFSSQDMITESAACRLSADSGSPLTNQVFVRNAILNALPVMTGNAPGESSWLVINGMSYELASGFWKKTRNGYIYRGPSGTGTNIVELVLDRDAGTLEFHANKFVSLLLSAANRLDLSLRIDDYASRGSFDLGGVTSWSFHNREASPRSFQIAKFTGRHNAARVKNDEIQIPKAFLGDLKGEIGDVALTVNQFAFAVSADRFTAKKTGVWTYDSRQGIDPLEPAANCRVVLNMNDGQWSFRMSGNDTSGVFSPDGMAKLTLKIGDKEATENLDLRQCAKWRK